MTKEERAIIEAKASEHATVDSYTRLNDNWEKIGTHIDRDKQASFLAGAEARDELAKEREAKLVALLEAAIDAVKAKDLLLAAYRVGKKPTEKMWDSLEKGEITITDAKSVLAEHHAAKGESNG